jgi:CheY-like chemotaxis protein
MQCQSILIIEDEPIIRETLRDSLELEGYKVQAVENGKEGLSVIRKMERPCLILLDLMMPIMNGFEFLDMKEQDVTIATIPVVIVSAFPDQAQKVNANGFVKKPIDLDLLLSFIKRFCS